jgi:multidrug efflux pump subunit AcrB
MWIVRLALRRPYTVAVFSTLILLFGVLTAARINVDIFPAIDIPVVIVVWNYPGLSAEDMERRVVLISERAYSTTVDGISHIESQSIAGIGILKVYFEPGADIGGAIAQIASVSATASRVMPPGIQPPNVIRFNASNVPVAQLTVASRRISEQALFDYGLNFIRVRLFTVPGMSIPAPYGGKARQIMVDVDPAATAARGLAVQDVVQAVLQSNVLVPAGAAEIGGIEYGVSINASPDLVEQFNAMPVRAVNGALVLLGDVARVRDSFAVQTNIVHVNGSRATYLSILKHANASTLAVVDATRNLLPAIRQAAPEGMELDIQFDQSVFVRAAVANVLREGVISTALVGLLILFFLGSWRSTLIVAVSIPLAILVGVTGLFLLGHTLNLMTLGGLALAIGMLVDDATVTIENIHRNRALGKPLMRAVVDGAREIAVPALAATLTICIVFFPVVLLTGPARYLFTALGAAVVIAMLASWLLSRTLVPAMARMLLEKERHGPVDGTGTWWDRFNAWRDRRFTRMQEAYVSVLRAFMARRWVVLGSGATISALTAGLLLVVGFDFFPSVDAGQMRLHLRAPIGTSIGETERIVERFEEAIRGVIPAAELETVNDNIGLPVFYNLAFVSTDNIGTQDAEILIQLKEHHRPTEEYRRKIRALQRDFPGVEIYFQPGDIVSQVLNFGLSAPVDVQVEGPDLRQSMELARTLRDRFRLIPGMEDVRIAQVLDYPALQVDVDRSRAAEVGLTERDVANNLLTTLSSSALVAPSFWVNPRNNVNYIVAVQTPRPEIRSVPDLLATPVGLSGLGARPAFDAGPAGAALTLGSVARVRASQQMALISHSSVQRVVDVLASVEGRDLGSVARDIDRVIAGVKLPRNTRINVRGQIESMRTSFGSLALGLVLASVLVYLLLVVLFQSWVDPFIIIFAVPGALVGIAWALALTGSTLNVESFMGAVMAVGLAVANSILLVSFANDLRVEDPSLDSREAAIRAGRARLRPVLMTALAMIVGMLPMAFALGEGGEQNAPLGRAVIGGLIVATAVTLLVVPLVYSLLRRDPPRAHALDEKFERELTEGAPEGDHA